MAKLNKELVWLAEQMGIKIKQFSTDAQLAGAIFIKYEALKEKK